MQKSAFLPDGIVCSLAEGCFRLSNKPWVLTSKRV